MEDSVHIPVAAHDCSTGRECPLQSGPSRERSGATQRPALLLRDADRGALGRDWRRRVVHDEGADHLLWLCADAMPRSRLLVGVMDEMRWAGRVAIIST